jgi:hypothetical protein
LEAASLVVWRSDDIDTVLRLASSSFFLGDWVGPNLLEQGLAQIFETLPALRWNYLFGPKFHLLQS